MASPLPWIIQSPRNQPFNCINLHNNYFPIFELRTFGIPTTILPNWTTIRTKSYLFSPVFRRSKYRLSCYTHEDMLLLCFGLFDFVDSDLVWRDNLLFDTVVATGIKKTGENYFGTGGSWCGLKIVSVRVAGMLE